MVAANGGCKNHRVPQPHVPQQTRGSQDASCAFCDIVAGHRRAEVVYRDEHAIAFLDRSPLFKGHVLVVPVEHFSTLLDLPSDRVEHFFSLVQRVAGAIPSALTADGTFIAMNNVVSQSVPHLHVHVVPRRRKDGLRGFFWPREKYADESDAAAFAARIRERLTA